MTGLESKGTSGSSSLINWFPNLRHELLNQWAVPVCAINWPLNGPISTSPEDDVTHSGVVDEHLPPLRADHAQPSWEGVGVLLKVQTNPW